MNRISSSCFLRGTCRGRGAAKSTRIIYILSENIRFVFFILKFGRKCHLVDEYRPISLLSCLWKVVGLSILMRIQKIIYKEEKLTVTRINSASDTNTLQVNSLPLKFSENVKPLMINSQYLTLKRHLIRYDLRTAVQDVPIRYFYFSEVLHSFFLNRRFRSCRVPHRNSNSLNVELITKFKIASTWN
jgi:hypothetical protein